MQESGLARVQLAAVRIFGENPGEEHLKLQGDELARLDRLVRFAAMQGWNVGVANRDKGALLYVIRSVTKLEVSLKTD
jgi:hypothetical protein